MRLTYDPVKRQVTLEQRGLDFEEAAVLFRGRHATLRDDRADYGEDRVQTYGTIAGNVVMVVWTVRGVYRRIISTRRCHGREEQKARSLLERSG